MEPVLMYSHAKFLDENYVVTVLSHAPTMKMYFLNKNEIIKISICAVPINVYIDRKPKYSLFYCYQNNKWATLTDKK